MLSSVEHGRGGITFGGAGMAFVFELAKVGRAAWSEDDAVHCLSTLIVDVISEGCAVGSRQRVRGLRNGRGDGRCRWERHISRSEKKNAR